MPLFASRVASVLAARLGSAAPAPFRVRAVGRELWIEHPDDWGFIMPLEWMEAEDEEEDAARLLELVVGNALSRLQDAVSEATTEPWPPLFSKEGLRAMAPYDLRWEGEQLHFWYGPSEDASVISFAPIALREVENTEA